MANKGAIHGRDNRDGGADPISGPWYTVINEGGTPPTDPHEPYVELDNGWEQPAAPLQEFSFRRGLSKLDFRGHLDSTGATSGTVAVTIPSAYRLSQDQFFPSVVFDGVDGVPALVYVEASTGEVTITFPL